MPARMRVHSGWRIGAVVGRGWCAEVPGAGRRVQRRRLSGRLLRPRGVPIAMPWSVRRCRGRSIRRAARGHRRRHVGSLPSDRRAADSRHRATFPLPLSLPDERSCPVVRRGWWFGEIRRRSVLRGLPGCCWRSRRVPTAPVPAPPLVYHRRAPPLFAISVTRSSTPLRKGVRPVGMPSPPRGLSTWAATPDAHRVAELPDPARPGPGCVGHAAPPSSLRPAPSPSQCSSSSSRQPRPVPEPPHSTGPFSPASRARPLSVRRCGGRGAS